MNPPVKDHPIPAMELPTGTTSDGTNGQVQGQNDRNSRTALPKRKPVPPVVAPSKTEFAVVEPASNKRVYPSAGREKSFWPFSGSPWGTFGQTRSRKYLIIGIVAAVLLLALIIGLAVGLTSGK